MSYSCKVLADSIGVSHGVRITTMEVTFPRFILAEFNTHCALSRNSASSRAIPPEKLIARVMEDPFVPEFNRRVKGMGVGELLDASAADVARQQWLKARDASVASARQLNLLDVDKSRVNRLLEPFMWHTVIVTATDWANFFAQRYHEGAQPEFQIVAKMMYDALCDNKPQELEPGEWHLPMVEGVRHGFSGTVREEQIPRALFYPHVSAGRVARVSFDNHWREEEALTSHERAMRLVTSDPGHWSPTEHPSMCLTTDERSHKYRGWKPLRKFYDNECVKD